MTPMLVGACWTLSMIRYGKHRKKDLRIFDAYYFGLNLILLDLLLGTTNPEILLLSSNFMTLVSPLSFSHCLVDEKRGFLTIQQSVNKLIIANRMFQTDPSIFPRGQHWLTCHKVGDSQKRPFGKNRGAGLWYSIYHHLPSGKLSHSELENYHVS